MSIDESSEIAILVLAAGSSSRMGRPKQLLPWKKVTLMEHAINTAYVLTDNFMVVLGANATKIRQYIQKENTIIHEEWQLGMGSSLAYGVRAIESKYDPEAILVMVVDQPLLRLEHYEGLVQCHQKNPNKICASTYEGIPGVPAIFPKQFFMDLKKLGADFGARKLLKIHKSSVLLVKTKGELIDLDTPEDYRSVISRLE